MQCPGCLKEFYTTRDQALCELAHVGLGRCPNCYEVVGIYDGTTPIEAARCAFCGALLKPKNEGGESNVQVVRTETVGAGEGNRR